MRKSSARKSWALGGIGLALGMLRFMNHYLPTVVRHVPPVALDLQVLGIAAAGVGVIILTMGVVPFALLWRSGLNLRETPRASASRRGRQALIRCAALHPS